MIYMIPAFILAFVPFKMNFKRSKAPKLSAIISWVIAIVFGIILAALFFEDGDIDTLISGEFMNSQIIAVLIIELIVLLVLNILTGENKVKAVFYSIGQTGASFALIGYIMLIIITIVFGGGSNLKNITSKMKTYSNEEDQYAKANGYFDAASANEKGFDTSAANNPGFDYTEKKN